MIPQTLHDLLLADTGTASPPRPPSLLRPVLTIGGTAVVLAALVGGVVPRFFEPGLAAGTTAALALGGAGIVLALGLVCLHTHRRDHRAFQAAEAAFQARIDALHRLFAETSQPLLLFDGETLAVLAGNARGYAMIDTIAAQIADTTEDLARSKAADRLATALSTAVASGDLRRTGQARVSLAAGAPGADDRLSGCRFDLLVARAPSDGGSRLLVVGLDMSEDRQLRRVEAAVEDLDERLLAGEKVDDLLTSLSTVLVAYLECSGLLVLKKRGDTAVDVVFAHGTGGGYFDTAQPRADFRRVRSEPLGRALENGQTVGVTVAADAASAWAGAARSLAIGRIDAFPLIANGSVTGVLGVFDDKRQNARSRSLLKRLAGRLALLFAAADTQWRMRLLSTALESTVNAVFITDRQGRIEWVNSAFSEITGYALEDVSGITPSLLKSGEHETEFYSDLWTSILAGKPWRGELVNRRRNGLRYYARQAITPIVDSTDEISHFVAIQEDITEWRAAEKRSEYLSGHDLLTGLPNRTLLMDRLDQAIARLASQKDAAVALLLLDLDGFKAINDTMTQAFGDAVLIAVATRLDARLRAADTAARMGSDEFAVLIESKPGVAEDFDTYVMLTAQEILSDIRALDTVRGEKMTLSASMGIARYPSDATTAEQLLMNADVALTAGRSAQAREPQFYSIPKAQEMTEKVRMRQNLNGAVERGELALVYQPQVDLFTGRYIGVEALLRWNSPDHPKVRPDQFIPVAEETGLILQIGEWVVEEACRQMQAWEAQGIDDIKVAVNISARQLEGYDFAKFMAETVAFFGLPFGKIEVELTETTLVNETPQIAAQLRSLHDLGIGIAIDDFGTGFSSLTYLRRFPITKVKIDRTFVATMAENESDQKIVKAVVGLADALGLHTIAEGAEDAEQVALLRELGCRELQGYFSGRPTDPDSLAALLKENRLCPACVPPAPIARTPVGSLAD